MRRTLMMISLVAVVLLILAQLGAALDYFLVKPPTPGASGPQNVPDLIFGLAASLGGVLGILAALAAGIMGLVQAIRAKHTLWIALIVGAAAVTIVGFCVSSFILVGLPRNPLNPLSIPILIPLVTLMYSLRVADA